MVIVVAINAIFGLLGYLAYGTNLKNRPANYSLL